MKLCRTMLLRIRNGKNPKISYGEKLVVAKDARKAKNPSIDIVETEVSGHSLK